MTFVLFYEKPGCATNARQKKALMQAGCTLIVQNLMQLTMGPDELRTYLEPLPVADWFNPNAPAVKNGEIDPGAFTSEQALMRLLTDPILIRRPLVSVNGQRMCGFDQERIESMIGTKLASMMDNSCSSADGESCPEP